MIEEPVFYDGEAELKITPRNENLFIAVPHLPHSVDQEKIESIQRTLLDDLLKGHEIQSYVAWYYTPMMLSWSRHLNPLAVVYDCMDELSAFKNAPKELILREAELFQLADLVFTGGRSLYQAKREQHSDVYAFPSSIDVPHFAQALSVTEDMPDQEDIPHPRIGYAGVIDERLDIDLLCKIAELRPDWHFVMIGPVVKIDEADLPKRDNIHYLGGKQYDELPDYIAGWDVAMMPFAMNESTKFISPTKTPEYLAAGRPVVSTPIRDVVRPYGENGLVHIAATPEEFAAAIETAINSDLDDHRERANEFLSGTSWNNTFRSMSELISEAVAGRSKAKTADSIGKISLARNS